MNVSEAIQVRRSVRSYADREVDRGTIRELFESVRLAPSARNEQPWQFVAVTDPDRREALYRASFDQDHVADAPVVVAGVSTATGALEGYDESTAMVNLAIALDHLSLRAAELGLGTCWIGAYDDEAVADVLEVPEAWRIVHLMTVGYPVTDLEPVEKDRKPLEEVLAFETCPQSATHR